MVANGQLLAYTLGAGLGLEAEKDYLLELSYPDDISRSMFVINRGAETMRGFYTGAALGDALGGYTNSNPESISLPQSGTDGVWRQLFTLHDRYPGAENLGRTRLPEDGIDVVIISLSAFQNPYPQGLLGVVFDCIK